MGKENYAGICSFFLKLLEEVFTGGGWEVMENGGIQLH